MNPIIAASYILLGGLTPQGLTQPPRVVAIECPAPANMRPLPPLHQNHLTVRWVGDRDYYDRGRHHHRHHPRRRLEDER